MIHSIPLADIGVSGSVPQQERRKRFDATALADLAASIRTHGVLQPIIVRPRAGLKASNGKPLPYELVAGERRLLASKAAGLELIPTVVRELTDEQVLEVQLIENLQREDLHPMQEAEGYHELMTKHGHPVEELHAKVGKSRSYVYGRLKLLALGKKARAAFYAGTISASIALLLARIPVEKLQAEALEAIEDDEMSYRDARDEIERSYMLRLAEATFPTDDAKLAGAGTCGACPKRTGNQPELFGDVKGADVCTDPVCFKKKTQAHANRIIGQARAEGREVITGAKAKKIMPYARSNPRGYEKLNAKNYDDPKSRTNRQILGADFVPTLLQDPHTNAVLEIAPTATVLAAIRKAKPKSSVSTNSVTAAEKKRRLENKIRIATYAACRQRIEIPALRTIALALYGCIEHDALKMLCQVRGFEAPQRVLYGSKQTDYHAIGKTIAKMSEPELGVFITDCIYATELLRAARGYRPHGDQVPTVENLAKELDVDVAAIRRALTPAPKKAKAKKKAKKKTATRAKKAAKR